MKQKKRQRVKHVVQQSPHTCVCGWVAGSDELYPVELHPALVRRSPEATLLRELTKERHHPLGTVLVLHRNTPIGR